MSVALGCSRLVVSTVVETLEEVESAVAVPLMFVRVGLLLLIVLSLQAAAVAQGSTTTELRVLVQVGVAAERLE